MHKSERVFTCNDGRDVGLRVCTSVWGAAQRNPRGGVKPRASVPVTSSGYPAVCTPNSHTVSVPRGNTFTRTLLLRRGNPEGFLTFAPLAPLRLLAA
ncbi:hypothetical protein EVAR_37814_1 [Eumeta japonica]|uniref:Uncharacterized protein n=1 Tax=Eumeta variegata TaxID=151549 RepID=A0A4C1W7P0_EUMVA|nr:hypothetical protein EVAR_37814_1 [Eumeta japonica]